MLVSPPMHGNFPVKPKPLRHKDLNAIRRNRYSYFVVDFLRFGPFADQVDRIPAPVQEPNSVCSARECIASATAQQIRHRACDVPVAT
jgi:hypothetical protein